MTIAAFVAAAFFVIGLHVLLETRRLSRLANEATQWPFVVGKVIESRISRAEPGRNTDDHFAFWYHYEVAGVWYVSQRIGVFGHEQHMGLRDMEVTSARYPEGVEVHVHYRPANPGYGVLEPGNRQSEGPQRRMAVFLLVTGAVIGIVALWHTIAVTPPAPTP